MNTLILKKWLISHTLQGPKFDIKFFYHSLYMNFLLNISVALLRNEARLETKLFARSLISIDHIRNLFTNLLTKNEKVEL
jgi:hypothetical protein